MTNPTQKNLTTPLRSSHGEVVYELFGRAAEHGGATRHSLAHIVLSPGKASLRHYHKVSEESYYILRGQGRMVVDWKEHTLTPAQAMLILPGQRHQIFNDGEEELEFLAICAPAWYPEDSYNED